MWMALGKCGWLKGGSNASGRMWMALGEYGWLREGMDSPGGGCTWLCGDGVSKAELMLPEASDSTETEQGPRCHARPALTWEQVTARGICAAYSFWDVLILL